MAEFKLDISDLLEGLAKCEDKAGPAMLMYARNGALKLQNSARKNAPWTDRTGHARQRLTCTTKVVDNGFQEELSHGVDYGIYLETRADFGGKYQILEKARDSEINNFKNMLRTLFS